MDNPDILLTRTHKTEDENKRRKNKNKTKQHNTKNKNEMQHEAHKKNDGEPRCSQSINNAEY